jgi:molybdate transport system substrate-binding protein
VKRALWALTLVLAVPAHAAQRTLTVFAAASLTEAFTEIGDSLQRRDPGIVARFNFSGSQLLALQITQGAPADVFASADERWMSAVRDSGRVEGAARPFARNRLVVIVPLANPAHLTVLSDLDRSGVKIVLAADAVPAGRYARDVIANLAHTPGYPADYTSRVLRNVVSEEENVRGVVTKVRLGEADAGIVYASDVTPDAAPHLRRLEIPDAANVLATYPIAVLRRAASAEAAREFVALVLSPAGQGVLARHGFLPIAGTR